MVHQTQKILVLITYIFINQMMRWSEEALEKDKILTVREQLAGFLLDEVISEHGEFFFDGHSYS